MLIYIVQKIKKNDDFYGLIHYASDDLNTTFCGREINENWYICGNIEQTEHRSNCKKCCKIKDNKTDD